jgi:hypothetical protein
MQIRGLCCKLNTMKCAHVNLKSKNNTLESCDITIDKCEEMCSWTEFVGLKYILFLIIHFEERITIFFVLCFKPLKPSGYYMHHQV